MVACERASAGLCGRPPDAPTNVGTWWTTALAFLRGLGAHVTLGGSMLGKVEANHPMWSAYLKMSPVRVAATRTLGTVSRRAYYGPLAPLRAGRIRKATPPGRRWVRVRNSVAGIAGADVARVYLDEDGRIALAALPRQKRIYLGSEVAGEVVDVGPEVEFLRVGDRVAYQLDVCCATRDIEPPCEQCAAGNYRLCANRYMSGPRGVGGGWGDEMLLHERQLFLVPDTLADEQAALLEPAAMALHTALHHLPQPGEQVLVIGAGTTGLLTIQALRVLAPSATIAVLARYPFQAKMAWQMGASALLDPKKDTEDVVSATGAQHLKGRGGAEMVMGGFDAVYDTVGSAETLERALRWVRAGGVVVQAGMHQARVRVDLTPIWQSGIRVIGAGGPGAESWPGGEGLADWSGSSGGRVSTFALAAELMREGKLTPELLVTHRFPLRELRRAVATARNKAEHQAIKVLLDIRSVAGSVTHTTLAPRRSTLA
ncbi:MAG: hypothetical protein OJF49_004129 [Ktedonobacterales bacterium]|nr:MAG: hypothetical protein OJF49_004129 [Ktedonobacterales bacterium]